MKYLIPILLWVSLSSSGEAPPKRMGLPFDALELVAIQERGRLKPLQTFANESVLHITGKRMWNGMKPIEVLFSWMILFDKGWEDEKFIKVGYEPLKKQIGLNPEQSHFSPNELTGNAPLNQILRTAAQKEQRKEKLDEIEKKAAQIQGQKNLIEAIVSGEAWTIFPNPSGPTYPWFSLATLTESQNNPFEANQIRKMAETTRRLFRAYLDNNASDWQAAATDFVWTLKNEFGKSHYASESALKLEHHYNSLHPFRWAWILYLAAFLILAFFFVTQKNLLKTIGLSALLGAFLLHAYGFTLRCLIAGRPPVTNMYESVIWVTWGCVLFGLIIFAVYRNIVIPTAGSVFAIVGLILADNLPIALDPTINPLEPVLRSNFWLTIHVLTITLSYAAFALSLCLGNVVLANHLFRPKDTAKIQQYSLYMYRAVQVGVVLLAAGTILGGVWADYSWGRFWGWDPKEVWALIALLLYLAVLHGRFTGWLKGFGFTACTVLCFLGVLMAWYGVNFVLGAGLHSYGFGTGGIGWVLGYILLQIGFILGAYQRYRKSGPKSNAVVFPRS